MLFLDDPFGAGLHPMDVSAYLKTVFKEDKNIFFSELKRLPKEFLGEVLLDFPEKILEETVKYLPKNDLIQAAKELDSDDATDFIQEIEEINSKKSESIFSGLGHEEQKEIQSLKKYSEDQAGSIMQKELFKASENETIKKSIKRLATLKASGELSNVHQVFIVDSKNKLKGAIALEDLITQADFNQKFSEILDKDQHSDIRSVYDSQLMEECVKIIEKYDLSYVPVIDKEGILLGRITSDDVIDAIEELATEQIYNLAGVDDEEAFGDFLIDIIQSRALWLFLNLLTALLASFIIGIFDQTIQKFIPLAILMPIVASMGGNAGTQTLTVTVRQLALGELDFSTAMDAVKKEVIISIVNGIIFALIVGLISYLWFNIQYIWLIIGLSMIISLLFAGFFGAIIPLGLKRMGTDPAFGSTVLLTTVTDMVGFFSFLWLAKVIL